MCRFTFYKGKPLLLKSIVSDPEHSIVHQSFNAKERLEPLNGDGFGIGWYKDNTKEPAIFKSTTPAWNCGNLEDLSRVIESRCVIAHVRAATFKNDLATINCHPFKIDNFMFCHNGRISQFGKIKRKLTALLSEEFFANIKGTTDSEYLFALFMQNLNEYKTKDSVTNMAKALRETIHTIDRLTTQYKDIDHNNLNVVITNSKQSVVSRYTSHKNKDPDSLYICQGMELCCSYGKCSMNKTEKSNNESVVISSEPLCKNGNWRKIKSSKILMINEQLNVKELNIY